MSSIRFASLVTAGQQCDIACVFALQLETVYVLTGLGPPEADCPDQKGSFAAKVCWPAYAIPHDSHNDYCSVREVTLPSAVQEIFRGL